MGRNILQKHWNGQEWIDIYPITKSSNVFSDDGESIEEKHEMHKEDKIHTSEIHGTKYKDGKLFIFNGEEWVESEVDGEMIDNKTISKNKITQDFEDIIDNSQLYKLTNDAGLRVRIPDGEDILEIGTGFYYGKSLLNAPDEDNDSWYNYDVSISDSHKQIIAIRSFDGVMFYTVTEIGEVFSGWKEVQTALTEEQKRKIFSSDVAPDDPDINVNDMWINTSGGNSTPDLMNRWNGTEWVMVGTVVDESRLVLKSGDDMNGTLNLNTDSGRLVIPVGTNKYATE